MNRSRLALLVLAMSAFACKKEVVAIGGTITGLAGSGLVLQNGADSLSITSDGPFAFAKAVGAGSTYDVSVAQQPSNPAQTCTVAGGSGVASGPVSTIAVTCATNQHAVGGTITGYSGSGLVLQDNGGDDLHPTGSGPFQFAGRVASGKTFTVTVQKQPDTPTQTCVVTGGSGTIVDGDVSSVSVNCTTNRYTIGGAVAGLQGTGLTLHAGTEDLPVAANGSFAFPTAVASGTPFAVTVSHQPTGPSQTCSVASGAGTIGSGNVTTIVVSCVTNAYPVGGSVSGLLGSGLVLQDNQGDNLSIPGDESFRFATSVPSGAGYAVSVLSQPSSPSQTCTVAGGSGTVIDQPVTAAAVTCTTNSYPVGGTVTGLRGAGLALTNNGGETVLVSADGAFVFPTAVASGQSYAVTVSAQPAGPSQSCLVSGGTGTIGGGAVTSVTVNCTVNTYTVGGSASGLAGSGLKLQISTGELVPVSGNGTYAFSTPLASGTTYTVSVAAQPVSPWQTCAVSNAAGTVGGQRITNVGVTCTTNQSFVTGTVTGLSGAGLVLRDNGGDDLAVPSSGGFKFPIKVASGAPYLVTVKTQPTAPSQTCSVSSGSGNIGGGDVSVSVACTTNQYLVGGSVSGLLGTVVVRNNGGDDLTLNSNGPFQFNTRVLSGASYAVTVAAQPATPSQTCTLGAATGPVVDRDIQSVSIVCITNTYSVTGTVTGLAGSGLTLLDNGGDSLSLTQNGSFKFATRVASGNAYAVTVGSQPVTPTQKCVVSGGAGQVGGSDVTSVVVNCSTTSFVVGGTVSGLSGSGLTLLDNNGDARSISGNGTFAFATPVASGAGYAVSVSAQPTTPWQTCAVTQGSGTVGNGDVTTVAVACTNNSYPLRVNVSGLAGSGLVLQNNSGDNLAVSGNGTASFATLVSSGASYSVTVLAQPASPSQTCAVASPTGTMGNGVTLAVTCTTSAFDVGGTVANLNAPGLVLQDNGGDDLAVAASGTFKFPTKVASGQAYSVTVKTQPSQLYCYVTNGAGTVGAGAVTNVSVQCGVATSCLAIKQASPSAATGVYAISPQGGAPTSVYCDMTTDGGGWMIMIYIRNPAQWSTNTFSDFGTVGDTANGFASGQTLYNANPSLTQKIIIYKSLIENGMALGQQWMENRRADNVAISFQSVQAPTGWNYFDSFGLVDTTNVLNACTHGCGSYRTFGMFHDYSDTVHYCGTQGGDYGCRDGNNICWMGRSGGCNVGSTRCAYLVGSGEGVLYGVR